MPRPSSAQPRRPAGVPTGGQFASANRPEARGIHLVEDEPSSSDDEIRSALLEIEQLGADSAERIVQVGRVAAALPVAARSVVAEVLDRPMGSRPDDHSAMVAPLAELALARAVHRAGTEHGTIEGLLSGLSKSAMQTDLERAARLHVRRAFEVEDEGDRSWVCPADPSHATRGGTCVTCGAMRASNSAPSADEPPVEAMEPTGEDAADPDDRELADGVAGDGPGKSGAGVARPTAPRPAGLHLDPASIAWTSCGDIDSPGGEDAQLLGTVSIGQTPFHVLALQVEEGRDGVQRALQQDEELATVMAALGDQSPYETVEIDGRPYVLLLSPHAR